MRKGRESLRAVEISQDISANLKFAMRRDLTAERLIRDSDHTLDPDACQGCGFLYSQESDEDCRYHGQIHDEAVNGVCIPPDASERVIIHHQKFEILKADHLSLLGSPASGERLRRAASIANEETSYDLGIFDEEEIWRGQVRVVWARERQTAEIRRIVGLAVIDSHVEIARILPAAELALAISGQNFGVEDIVNRSDLQGIRFVWVLRKHRRTGLAVALVESGFAQSSGGREGVCFCYPFTIAGARLIYEIARRAAVQSILVYH